MVSFPGYHLTDLLDDTLRTQIYRGVRQSDQRRVVIKLLKAEYPTLRDLVQFRNQYAVTKNLSIPGVVQPYSLEDYHNGFALVMEDFGGIPLADYFYREACQRQLQGQSNSLSCLGPCEEIVFHPPLQEVSAERDTNSPLIVAPDISPPLVANLDEFLTIALQIVQILEGLACNRVVHKDLKPQHILINPDTTQVKLIGFSLASLLPTEKQEIQNPDVLEGTLAYMSPEQTGRMNRGIDYRTDFYSLGVTFYQLLTGQLPFQSTDPMELVHCHLARKPAPLNTINPAIPQMVNDIVLKLMAKMAEERYQSTLGLRHDLERCLEQYLASGTIESFPLGERDISDSFQISEKLYGRESEVATLLAAFERVSAGNTELILVSGFSGVGKTALVNEVHKPIVRQRGYFIKGKFDQLKRNTPLSALVQAFQHLMRQLLTENSAQVECWKDKILSALGENARVLIEVIPELERIIGPQPPALELSPGAAQNRFNLLFGKFIQVFVTQEHPLVIFLDDLQWAGSDALKLIQLLMVEIEARHLLLIGAYRDNEVNSSHPLMLTLKDMGDRGATINQMTLTPLPQEALNELIADTLSCPLERAVPLTTQVLQKTQGNPFFSNQFLKSLHQDGLISFDYACGYWQCDIAQVKWLSVSSNVVEFMAGQLLKLPEKTQAVLKLAACIGNQFDLAILAIVYGKSQAETAVDLWQALQEGLGLPTSEIYRFYQGNERFDLRNLEDTETRVVSSSPLSAHNVIEFSVPYKFLHDRVQQAAYSLIPEDQKQTTHLKIGQLLLQNTAPEERDERIFEIADQLNIGVNLIFQPIERRALAQLNLAAGQKARASTAYESAAHYLKVGISLLPADSWQQHYELTLALYETATEVSYLNGRFEDMERWAETVLRQAQSLLDKIKVYEVKIQAYASQNKLMQSVLTALQVLQLLGVKLPPKPDKLKVLLALLSTKFTLAGKNIETLIDLPEMVEPEQRAIMRIIRSVGSPAYLATPELMPLLAFAGVNLSLQYGNMAESAYGYASYGVILCGVLENIDQGYQFGKLALNVLEKFNAKAIRAKTIFVVTNFINHWKKHVVDGLKPLLDAYQDGLETGDVEFAAYSVYVYCYHSYFAGRDLTEIEPEMVNYRHAIAQLNQEATLNLLDLYRQVVLNLMGRSPNPCHLVGENYDEVLRLDQALQANHRAAVFDIYFQKSILNYLFERYTDAAQNADLAVIYLDGIRASLSIPLFHFYDSLVQLGRYSSVSPSKQKLLLRRILKNQKKLKQWAHHAPMNHLHKFYLVEAEKARVLGRHLKAITYYEQAIAHAKIHSYINEEALAYELAAKFYLAWGKEKIAQTYLAQAYYAYARWGAKAKVEDLETRYARLITSVLHRQITPSPEGDSAARSQSYRSVTAPAAPHGSGLSVSSKTLDLATVLKASQALTREIQLDQLLAALIKVLTENMGAEKGIFILVEKDKQIMAAQYPSSLSESDRSLRASQTSLAINQDFPVTLANYVARTHEILVLNDTTPDPIFAADVYIIKQQPKSVLCAPIVHQGKLMGILYLENNLTTGIFNSDRLVVLNILTAQAAISLQNALLYEHIEDYSHTLELTVQERTQELQQLTQDLQQEAQERQEALRDLISAEIALRQSEKKFSTAFQASPNPISISILESARIIEVNDSFCRASGYAREELIGKTSFEVELWVNPQERNRLRQILKQQGVVRDQEFQVRTKSGEVKTALLSTEVIKIDSVPCLLTVISDITERKQTEAALQQAKESAEVANRAKSEFLSKMSHELRTPLNAILGFAELMNIDPSLSPEHKAHLSIINRSGEHLLKLINNVLEMSKIEAGQVTLNENSFDLYQLLDNLHAMLQLEAASKDLKLIFERATNVPKRVRADEGKLRQVLINLLSNAIKFTAQGNVTLRVRGGSALNILSSATDVLYFEVEDTGSGIVPDEIAHLFDPFIQGNRGQKFQEGTGLGLSIARQFVSLMGGTLTASSMPNQGTIFRFDIQICQTLPVGELTEQSRKVMGLAPDQPSYRILIVEDDRMSRLLLVRLLKSVGFQIREAVNGQEAIDIWQSWRPHFIWMDMQMPVMDGCEATRQIRKREEEDRVKKKFASEPYPSPIIVVLTANAFEENRTVMLSAGCDDFVSKPFRREHIFAKLAQYLGVVYLYRDFD